MNRSIRVIVAILILLVHSAGHAWAVGLVTPAAWQDSISAGRFPGLTVSPAFFGQRKNATWIRDRDHNFVDDLIQPMNDADTIDIILDLNRALSKVDIQTQFGGFGRIEFISNILTAAFLQGVVKGRVDSLAAFSDVAMVEWQPPIHLAVAYSTREIQARSNTSYHGSSQYPTSAQSRGQTGSGIGIAVLDTGIDERHASIPDEVHGFNARAFEDTNGNGIDDSCEPPPLGDGRCDGTDDEPADGTTNPSPCTTTASGTICQKHGTYVAGVALGRGFRDPTDKCAGPKTPSDERGLAINCTGTAVNANLIDVRVCPGDVGDCSNADVTEGLEWVATHAAALGIRVANLSFAVCADDDPTGMLPSLVDYLVQSGVVVVAGHGNRDRCLTANLACDPTDPNRRSLAPGVAPMALTVSATNDKNTIKRRDDEEYSSSLHGPRCGFDPAAPDRACFKPDLSAPGYGIWAPVAGSTTNYMAVNGTSISAPHAAGAAAIVLGANPSMDPGSVCDLLLRTADPPNGSSPYKPGTGAAPVDPVWSNVFGMGIVNVDGALAAMKQGEVAFPSCDGDPGHPGSPCLLVWPRQPWENDVDLHLELSPVVSGSPNRIHATIVNRGIQSVTVDVDFGISPSGSGLRSFSFIGRRRVTVSPGLTADAVQDWIPGGSGDQCVQAAIRYGSDTLFWNNVTQRVVNVQPASSITVH